MDKLIASSSTAIKAWSLFFKQKSEAGKTTVLVPKKKKKEFYFYFYVGVNNIKH